jgi:hypothetical protein
VGTLRDRAATPPLLADDRLLSHQVLPAKLAVDVAASFVSNALLWRHHLGLGLLVRFGLPLVGSALVLSFADGEGLRSTPAGAYVLAAMPPGAMAARLAGDALMAVGSWHHQPPAIAAGLLIVVASWSHGLPPTSENRGWISNRW